MDMREMPHNHGRSKATQYSCELFHVSHSAVSNASNVFNDAHIRSVCDREAQKVIIVYNLGNKRISRWNVELKNKFKL